MEKRTRKNFSKDFKDNAVKLVVDGGERIRAVAERLSISEGLLSRWKREAQRAGPSRFPGKGHQAGVDEVLTRLRRENARLREERSIFKKAVKYFSQETI